MASGDGSAPFIGEIPEADSGRPRVARTGDRAAGITLDPTNSPEMRAHNAAALAAQAAHNSGASDQGSPVRGLDDPVPAGGSGVTGSGNTWSDPSSRSRR